MHPAIILAIKRWQGLVMNYGKHPVRSEYARIAQTHLSNIGKLLVSSAKERQLPASVVTQVWVEQLHYWHHVLRVAWECLGSPEVKKRRRPQARLSALLKKMRELSGQIIGTIEEPQNSSPQVSDQLESVIGLIKYYFQNDGEKFLTNRRSWNVIKANFTEFLIPGLSKETLRGQRKHAKSKVSEFSFDMRFWDPRLPSATLGYYASVVDCDAPWHLPKLVNT